MKLTILGSGTSHGVPVIGCSCGVCTSSDPKNNRLRSSALLEVGEKFYLIDVGPDFRQQALRQNICRLDGVFLTHSHADHIHGIDDLRIFSHKNSRAMNEDKFLRENYPETEGNGLPIYTREKTGAHIRSAFSYIFVDHDKGGGIPKLDLVSVDSYDDVNPLKLDEMVVVPVPMLHGNHHTTGWIFLKKGSDSIVHAFAYLTDCSLISPESIKLIKNVIDDENVQLDHLVIDALREKPHSSHNSFDQALSYGELFGARHTWFTHMTHDKSHQGVQKYIDEHLEKYPVLTRIVQEGGSVSPAYDGLTLKTY